MRRLIAILIISSAVAAWAETPELAALIARADAAQQPKAALAILQQAEKLQADNPDVLVRISRRYSDLADLTESQEFAQKALDYAKRAVQVAPNSAKAHRSIAIAYGTMTDYVGNKTKVEYSKLIKEAAEKSIALDPTDDFTWYILGRWNSGVANVSGFLRAMVRMIYGKLPPASNEEAVRCFNKAIEIEPHRLVYHSSLARTYTAMGKTEQANKEWKTVLTLKAADSEEEADKKEAQRMVGGGR